MLPYILNSKKIEYKSKLILVGNQNEENVPLEFPEVEPQGIELFKLS